MQRITLKMYQLFGQFEPQMAYTSRDRPWSPHFSVRHSFLWWHIFAA